MEEVNKLSKHERLLFALGAGTVLGLVSAIVDRIATRHFQFRRSLQIGLVGGAFTFFARPRVSINPAPLQQLSTARSGQEGLEENNLYDPYPKPDIPDKGVKIRPSKPKPEIRESLYNIYKTLTSDHVSNIRQAAMLRSHGLFYVSSTEISSYARLGTELQQRLPQTTRALVIDVNATQPDIWNELRTLISNMKTPVILVGLREVAVADLEGLDLNRLYAPGVIQLRQKEGELLPPETKQALKAACPDLPSDEPVAVLFLDQFNKKTLLSHPQAITLVMPADQWNLPTLNLRELSPEMCEEILSQAQGVVSLILPPITPENLVKWHTWGYLQSVRQLTLDENFDDEGIHKLQHWGVLNSIQKLDLTRTIVTTDCFQALTQLPNLSIITFPEPLTLGDQPLPRLYDPVLIRELYAKNADLWEQSSSACNPYWASIPNAHAPKRVHQLPTLTFKPTTAAIKKAKENISFYHNAMQEQDVGSYYMASATQELLASIREVKSKDQSDDWSWKGLQALLDIVTPDPTVKPDPRLLHSLAEPVIQESCVWLMQEKLLNDQFNRDDFKNLWVFVNQRRFAENYPVRALRCSLRLWAESQWPEWIFDPDLVAHTADLPRFNPHDPDYCDFKATLLQNEGEQGEDLLLHKQIIGAAAAKWGRLLLEPAKQVNQSAMTRQVEYEGLMGANEFTFIPENAGRLKGARQVIVNVEAYSWFFDLAYDPSIIDQIPNQLTQEVLLLCEFYEFSPSIRQQLFLKRVGSDINLAFELTLGKPNDRELGSYPEYLDCVLNVTWSPGQLDQLGQAKQSKLAQLLAFDKSQDQDKYALLFQSLIERLVVLDRDVVERLASSPATRFQNICHLALQTGRS